MSKEFAVGIDLGTYNSRIAIYQEGKVTILTNDCGQFSTSCYVSFNNEDILIGDAAKNRSKLHPETTIFDNKLLMGKRLADSFIQTNMKEWPFTLSNSNNMATIQVDCNNGEKRHILPEELSAMILSKLKHTAESYVGETIRDVVLCVPVEFNQCQRQATINAGRMAGLNVLRTLNESTAAMLAYGMKTRHAGGDQNILVYNSGGSFCNISVASVDGTFVEMLSTSGSRLVGGRYFDQRIVNRCLLQLRNSRRDISQNQRALICLKRSCERAKVELSSCCETQIEIDSLVENFNFTSAITRKEFERLCHDLFSETMKLVEKSLSDAKLSKSDIHHVVLVGGSSRIPKVQQMLKVYFNRNELFNLSLQPDETVAYGAAIRAALLKQNVFNELCNCLLADIVSLPVSVEISGPSTIIDLVKSGMKLPVDVTKLIPAPTNRHQMACIKLSVFEGCNAEGELIAGCDLDWDCQYDVRCRICASGDMLLSCIARSNNTDPVPIVMMKKEWNYISEEDIKLVADRIQLLQLAEMKEEKRIEAKNVLEEFLYNMKPRIEAEPLFQTERYAVRRKRFGEKCQQIVSFLDLNQQPSQSECEFYQKELNQMCSLIVQSLSEDDYNDIGVLVDLKDLLNETEYEDLNIQLQLSNESSEDITDKRNYFLGYHPEYARLESLDVKLLLDEIQRNDNIEKKLSVDFMKVDPVTYKINIIYRDYQEQLDNPRFLYGKTLTNTIYPDLVSSVLRGYRVKILLNCSDANNHLVLENLVHSLLKTCDVPDISDISYTVSGQIPVNCAAQSFELTNDNVESLARFMSESFYSNLHGPRFVLNTVTTAVNLEYFYTPLLRKLKYLKAMSDTLISSSHELIKPIIRTIIQSVLKEIKMAAQSITDKENLYTRNDFLQRILKCFLLDADQMNSFSENLNCFITTEWNNFENQMKFESSGNSEFNKIWEVSVLLTVNLSLKQNMLLSIEKRIQSFFHQSNHCDCEEFLTKSDLMNQLRELFKKELKQLDVKCLQFKMGRQSLQNCLRKKIEMKFCVKYSLSLDDETSVEMVLLNRDGSELNPSYPVLIPPKNVRKLSESGSEEVRIIWDDENYNLVQSYKVEFCKLGSTKWYSTDSDHREVKLDSLSKGNYRFRVHSNYGDNILGAPSLESEIYINSDVDQCHSRQMECQICMENERNCVLVPCGHSVFCKDCASNLKPPHYCPICRQIFSDIQRIFL